ncbi:hypothetical protein [Paenibacillus sp. NPDC058177]|uniref:hypothetical protein n=1 Tax=Paenibacillus sp. NPDC058177 TaxID=3346369 RepID=UPI0036DF685F
MNQQQRPTFGGNPFFGFGDKVCITETFDGSTSPQELVELLAIAKEIRSSGANIAELKAKADLAELRDVQLSRILEANERLAERVGRLEQELLEVSFEKFIAPSYPKDFAYYGSLSESLNNVETQELVLDAASVEISAGEFNYVAMGNTAVIRMNDGKKIITVVAQNFYEALEDAL